MFDGKEIKLLEEILYELRVSNRFQNEQLRFIGDELVCIERKLDAALPEVEEFSIKQTGDTMPLIALDPGNSPQFTATPQPVPLPAGIVPAWSADDTTNVSISADPTGLVATVNLSPNIPVGQSVTLTVQATLADGTTPSGTFQFTVGAPPPPAETTSFSIAQTA